MDPYLLDWANLLLRWLHVVAAIAWIGSSFHFIFLDNSLEPPQDAAQRAAGVTGEMWAVHGGGFYNPQKYNLAPPRMPHGRLHWFYWESYWTWISGFALFAVMYLWRADVFLVDTRVHAWSPRAAGAAAVGFLLAGWVVYDGICRLFGRTKDGGAGHDLRVGALLLLYVGGASWLACRLFAGRAAFLVTGATLATLMTANVLFWIIPGQRKVVAALAGGRTPDPLHGRLGKQRSVHNTYLTLPVLIAMLSHHYPMLYRHPQNWLVLLGLMVLGAAIRQFFVLRQKGRSPWQLAAGSAVLVIALILFVAPDRGAAPAVSAAAPEAPSSATPPANAATPDAGARGRFTDVQAIVNRRCVLCHSEALPSKDIRLDTPELIVHHAAAIQQQAVATELMPLNNATEMTAEERGTLGRWFENGARPH